MHIPTKPFGNLDFIFCGDICQADPVHDSQIFEQPIFHQQTLPYTFWYGSMKYYELKTIVRIRTCNQTIDDITYLNMHCHRQQPLDPTFPSLSYCNKDVQKHNTRMLSIVETEAFTLASRDTIIDTTDKNCDTQKTMQLPPTIMVRKTRWSKQLEATTSLKMELSMVQKKSSKTIQGQCQILFGQSFLIQKST